MLVKAVAKIETKIFFANSFLPENSRVKYRASIYSNPKEKKKFKRFPVTNFNPVRLRCRYQILYE